MTGGNLREKDQLIPQLQQLYQVDEKLAENLYLFFVSGAFAVNQKNHWQKDENWYRFQAKLLTLLRALKA